MLQLVCSSFQHRFEQPQSFLGSVTDCCRAVKRVNNCVHVLLITSMRGSSVVKRDGRHHGPAG